MYGGNIPPVKVACQCETVGEIIEAISPRPNQNEDACGCEVSR
jgi:hypothetical protein